ncbi:bifunctional diguanylate cyclase/phosphodiesterase [Marinobacter halophilus]|uniref:GGDEF domain-containing protein n=1 Tax=Marinobacter halophilus TaxID=1323740 RepID=A0A2T1KD89_9GAMM|nr:EAL domain-containing protein [Marinobacter halophilus]PSF08075.1 hypothetical protein C7H08_11820 [Marinobacter halophilus]GGC59566.1 hypothetical protein GCM10011362_04930 [Marinobacter halophilus]
MFLSLKWKAVIFLSIVLVIISVAWGAQRIIETVSTYEEQVDQRHNRQQLILNQLLADNALRLSQLAQLISDNSSLPSANRATDTLGSVSNLRAEWITLNINTGIDYIGFYAIDGSEVQSAFNETLFQDAAALETAIAKTLEDGEGAPHTSLYCGQGCSQFVVEPFIGRDGKEALIIVGQSLADVIQRYQNMANDDLAIILPRSDMVDISQPDDRRLEGWGRSMWAASRFQRTMEILSHAQSTTSLEQLINAGSLDYGELRLLIKPLDLINLETHGLVPDVLAISDETSQHNDLVNSVKTSVFVSVLALLVSEVILLLIMLGPLRRLLSVVDALTLLPKHEYQRAHQTVRKHSGYFQDELSLLEKSTQYVTQQLEELHIDVEEKKQSLKNQIAIISRSRAFLERLIDSSQLFIVTHRLDGVILSSNDRFETEFGHPTISFSSLFISSESQTDYFEKLEALRRDDYEVIQFDAEFANDQGQAVYVDWTCSKVEDEDGQHVVLATGVDLTQRRRDEETLAWLASHDPLTSIGNRRGFQHDLRKALDSHSSGAVIFIDVNRFKQINDLYGHTVGDDVLIQIAEVLRASVRESDSISRLAGDEFTIVLPQINEVQLSGLLKKLTEQLNGQVPLKGEDRVIEYNVSIGAALIPDHGNTEQELIVHADMAMYQAKKRGGGQWQIFDPESNDLEELRRDHDLTTLIKMALRRDDLFELNYQPIYSIHRHEISHHEALLRLKDMNGRPVFPGDFIPAAERMGLIRRVDEWVMTEAIKHLAELQKSQSATSFAINISAPTLQSADFPDTLIDLANEYGVPPECIIVELTETAYVENFKMVLENLERISGSGFLVALDDFGVGFSSFSYLKKLPLTYVKLDGSYILNLQHNPDNQVFVKSLTEMVKAFGMETIAEFVEDEETLKKLEDLGVGYAQGYYIGRPTPELCDSPMAISNFPSTAG